MSGSVLLENDELELQAYFRERDMTDGLPIVVPTAARVLEEPVDAVSRRDDDGQPVGHVPLAEVGLQLELVVLEKDRA